MDLGKPNIELMNVIERATGLDNYTLIPKVIRGEIKEIVWSPQLVFDADGTILKVVGNVEIRENEKIDQSS